VASARPLIRSMLPRRDASIVALDPQKVNLFCIDLKLEKNSNHVLWCFRTEAPVNVVECARQSVSFRLFEG
jgi:hypothetical protein